MPGYQLSNTQVQQFQRDGYLILPQFLPKDQVDVLFTIAKADREFDKASGRKDAQDGVSKLRLRNDLPDDIYSAIARSETLVAHIEQLLGDEVYHFHHKMMLKEPKVGGAWEWHQDYGYWYKFNYCLYPDMGSCMIAVDRATKENGCLQVLKGSHLCGRIEHGVTGEQTGADMDRVNQLMKRLELVYVELAPGDACFFHANLLHRSDQNRSDHARWSLICCYNTKHNNPYKEIPGGHPCYSPLERWPDAKIMEIGQRQLAAHTGAR